MKRKIVGYSHLNLFWTKLKKWLELNFESLFENDEKLENKINTLEQNNRELQEVIDDLLKRVESLEATDFTTEDDD